MKTRHSEALIGVANALSEFAKEVKGKGKAEELKMLSRQVRELQGYWQNDEDAAEVARSGKRLPQKTEYKTLHVGPRHTVSADQMDGALASLVVEGWEVFSTHADLATPAPQWAIMLRRMVSV
jgi:hypothetical protein